MGTPDPNPYLQVQERDDPLRDVDRILQQVLVLDKYGHAVLHEAQPLPVQLLPLAQAVVGVAEELGQGARGRGHGGEAQVVEAGFPTIKKMLSKLQIMSILFSQ